MIKICSVIFVYLHKWVVTIRIQVWTGEYITVVTLTNIIFSVFNVVVKLLGAFQNLCDMAEHKKQLIT